MRNSDKSAPKQATREHHPSVFRGPSSAGLAAVPFKVPVEREKAAVTIDSRTVRLTNLNKPFWPELGITKGDLLQYYADVARFLLPHIRDRAMVMKRYPNGAFGDFFFMKRAPSPRPKWIALCEIGHASGNIIHYPVVQDLPTLLWIINLGCIDLNPWYARCDDVDRPDYMHFDLDPVKGDVPVAFAKVCEVALRVKDALDRYKIPSFAKTSGSRGIHVYVPIARGPTQKQVWAFAKAFARRLAAEHPSSITAEYRLSKRPEGHVLIDYNQNAWGRTLACVYSVRPHPRAAVSIPVTWEEIERGFEIEDFTIRNIPERLERLGDLWQPMLGETGRLRLEEYL